MTKRWIFLSENHLNLLSERCKESSDSLGRSHSLDVGDLGDLSGSDLIGSFSSSSSLISCSWIYSNIKVFLAHLANGHVSFCHLLLSHLVKGHMSFCHHLASVVRRKLSHLNLLLWNPWTELNLWSFIKICLISIICINRLKEKFHRKKRNIC
jgi:hypothetical protein